MSDEDPASHTSISNSVGNGVAPSSDSSLELQADAGIGENSRSDGYCGCDTSSADDDCDYSYISAEVCNALGYGGGEYDEVAERSNNEYNNDDFYFSIWVFCPLDSIYYYHEGYSAADIGQIVVYAIDNNSGSDSANDTFYAKVCYRGIWDEGDSCGLDCTLTGASNSVRACDVPLGSGIPASEPLVGISARIPHITDWLAPSGIHSIRVCFIPPE